MRTEPVIRHVHGRIVTHHTDGRVTWERASPKAGLGDVIAAGTKAVGIEPCEPCKKRQGAMNRATPGWLSQLLGKALRRQGP